ncbi:21773_t:CDS:2 [Gigaspora margarita]|uniref:21773_t:CDS:1 n=1 Tax=Gigaspora margarita TaxID=4874 RepID=A0ABN7WBU0_GIGMA|nr:21773_t:CDS:2 [Gigaspora margarita]
MSFYKRFIKKQTFIIYKFKSVETQTKEFKTKEWFYEEFGWENGNSTPFNKVDEQNNEDSTLEQSTESQVHKKVKTSTPNSKYKNHSNNFQQTVIEEDNSILIRLRLSTDNFVYKGYDGYNIEETTKNLVSSKLNPKNLPIIRVCIINRGFFLADNKRLYCLKKAIKNGAKFNKVPVKIVRDTDEKAGFK